jgi:hypothetical protein
MTASDVVQYQWARRIEAEYVSSVYAQDHARRLTALGAPTELIHDALDVAHDELRHAQLSSEVSQAAGGVAATPINPSVVAIAEPTDLLATLITDTVLRFCLAETLAVRLFRLLHDEARVEAAKAALDQIVIDEPRHAALGWSTLDWLLDAYETPTRSIVHRIRDDGITRLRAAYSAPSYALTRYEREWGLVSPSDYTTEFDTTVTRDFLPRFERRGL